MTKKQKAGISSKPSPQLNKKEIRRIAGEMKGMALNDVNVGKKKRKSKQKASASNFGPVSSITTAPVAIGNSVRGSTKKIVRTANGVQVTGRDFMFAPIGTAATVNDWTVVGGSPLTPAAFADSVIANYQRMYMKFRFKSFVVHYITSSPTSSSGDVMFYYGKDRSSVFLNQTSSQLLPFVFTDQNTVLGPQWTNHSAQFAVTSDWKLTDYGMHDGVEEYADGEVFLLSKTSTTDSPGYVIFDYVVEFAQESFQPRLLLFPIPRIQWKCTSFGTSASAVTTDTSFNFSLRGNDLSGNAATMPTNAAKGDIYKIIFDVTNSGSASWTNVTASNLIENQIGNVDTAFVISDGFTCYGVWDGTFMQVFPNATQAYTPSSLTGSNNTGSNLTYGVSATVTFNMICWISYIGTALSTANFPNF